MTVTCKNYIAANNLLDLTFLTQYTVFVPSSKVECTRVVYAKPDVPEEELMYEIKSTFPMKKKKRFNNELINSNFIKITFIQTNFQII